MRIGPTPPISHQPPAVPLSRYERREVISSGSFEKIKAMANQLSIKDLLTEVNNVPLIHDLVLRLEVNGPLFEFLSHLIDDIIPLFIALSESNSNGYLTVGLYFKKYFEDARTEPNLEKLCTDDFFAIIKIVAAHDIEYANHLMSLRNEQDSEVVFRKSFELLYAIQQKKFEGIETILASVKEVSLEIKVGAFKKDILCLVVEVIKEFSDDFLTELGIKILAANPHLTVRDVFQSYTTYAKQFREFLKILPKLPTKDLAEFLIDWHLRMSQGEILECFRIVVEIYPEYQLDVSLSATYLPDAEYSVVLDALNASADVRAREYAAAKFYSSVPTKCSDDALYDVTPKDVVSDAFPLYRELYMRGKFFDDDYNITGDTGPVLKTFLQLLSPNSVIDPETKKILDSALIELYVNVQATDLDALKILLFSKLGMPELLFIKDEDLEKYLSQFKERFDAVLKERSIDMIIKLGFRNFRWNQPMDKVSYTKSQVADIHAMMRHVLERYEDMHISVDKARIIITKLARTKLLSMTMFEAFLSEVFKP